MQTLYISEREEGKRLDKFLSAFLDKAPKSFVYKMLRKKNIKLNGKKADGSDLLKNGDELQLFLSDETIASFHTETIKKINAARPKKLSLQEVGEIVYEDSNVIFFNKKAGVLSQKSKPEDESLNDVLLDYVMTKKNDDKSDLAKDEFISFTPSICNRLDRNTSGLITFAKNYQAARLLNEMFRDRCVSKYYITAVHGRMAKGAKVSAFLKKSENSNQVIVKNEQFDGAMEIKTEYSPIASNGELTILRVKLITGKTHQIRAHLSYLGYPIIGDVKYGDKKVNELYKKKYAVNSQLLHSYELVFPNLSGNILENLSEQSFKARLPYKFKLLYNTCVD
ncbi:MAG: RluA family pseudouridine synthase [Eubacteriales bacterium]|nr:RluA family pseudouridine synthase [Eubacteriales bacterium]